MSEDSVGDLDSPGDEIAAAVADLNLYVARIVAAAWSKGLRDGMDAAAELMDSVRHHPVSSGCSSDLTTMLAYMSERLRLAALGLRDANLGGSPDV